MNTSKIVFEANSEWNEGDFYHEILKGKIIAFEYRKGGHPFCGVSVWQYAAIKYVGKLYIVNYKPHNDDEDSDIEVREIIY